MIGPQATMYHPASRSAGSAGRAGISNGRDKDSPKAPERTESHVLLSGLPYDSGLLDPHARSAVNETFHTGRIAGLDPGLALSCQRFGKLKRVIPAVARDHSG